MQEDTKTEFLYCSECKHKTNHDVLNNLPNHDKGEDIFYNGEHVAWIGMYRWHRLVQCKGCKTVSLLTSELFSDNLGEEDPITYRYPADKYFTEPKWIDNLPEQALGNILKEVYIALQYRCFALASSGIRTVLDTVFIHQVGDIGSFETKVNAMIEQKLLAERQKNTIMTVIDAGSASAHRGFIPNEDLLGKALRITETLLEVIYIHPDDASSISCATPKRPFKQKT